MKNDILTACGEMLINHNLNIAFAESATAGRMAAEFSLLENAGKFLIGGLVCYDAGVKKAILKVPHALIEQCTPESEEVTEAITRGLHKLMEADLHVGVTGLTTSGGSETKEKPVGTMFIHCLYNGEFLFQDRVVFKGSAEDIILQTVAHTASLLMDNLAKP